MVSTTRHFSERAPNGLDLNSTSPFTVIVMIYRAYQQLTDVPHVVVDGSAQAGTVLALSHWPGSATPHALRRDLSAEIAFAYLDHPGSHVVAGFVTNNHFDQDGIVSVFALTEPEAALARREQLIDVARAGDFGRFQHRDAARAAITLANLEATLDGDAYTALLPRLTEIVDHIERFHDYWADEDAHIAETEHAIATGAIIIDEVPELDLAIVTVPPTWSERIVHRFTTTDTNAAHPYALHNATDRFAILTRTGGAPELRYRYETWVHYVSSRPRPRVDLTNLAAELTALETDPGRWTFDGVDSLSPALHLVLANDTAITDELFTERVVAELSAARCTWSPYDSTP